MNKGLAILAASVGLAAISVPAAAQDTGFSGPWVAGVAGYDINKTGSSRDIDNQDIDQSIEGLVYGAAIGYDMDMGNVVVGAEAELTDSTADRDNEPAFNTQPFGISDVAAGRDIYLGGRLGVKATPNTLVYVKGGYTAARYNYTGNDGTADLRTNIDLDGWRAGAGIEQKIGTNAFAKVEYRYSNYSKGEIDFEADNVNDSDRFGVDLDRHQVMAGVGWRF